MNKMLDQISFHKHFKQFNSTLIYKSSEKMESVTMDVVAEENQEECLRIRQDQASGEEVVSMRQRSVIVIY